jgi:hypothetical protein
MTLFCLQTLQAKYVLFVIAEGEKKICVNLRLIFTPNVVCVSLCASVANKKFAPGDVGFGRFRS